jgi:hypothetical protein
MGSPYAPLLNKFNVRELKIDDAMNNLIKDT